MAKCAKCKQELPTIVFKPGHLVITVKGRPGVIPATCVSRLLTAEFEEVPEDHTRYISLEDGDSHTILTSLLRLKGEK